VAVQPGSLIYALKQLETILRPRFTRVCVDHGLTATQFTALTVLSRRPGLTSSELARRSFVTAQSMAGTLEPLLERGLVSREQDPGHGRRMLLTLTGSDEAVIQEAGPDVLELEDSMVDGLSHEDRVQLEELLRHCRRALGEAEPATVS
jgi:DNA-binding MarR family transcriptional regulator